MTKCVILFLGLLFASGVNAASSKDFKVNCCVVVNPPSWLQPHQVSGAAAQIEDDLDTIIKRITVKFHDTMASFQSSTSIDFPANAVFVTSQQTVHVSPQKDFENFVKTFRHELVHAVFSQKYKGSIPNWLEEGLANDIGSKRDVNYKWLSTQKLPDVTTLSHPSLDRSGVVMHYQLSTAAAQMIRSKCSMNDLLMLSVKRKLEDKLKTYCKINDVNESVRTWVAEKAKG